LRLLLVVLVVRGRGKSIALPRFINRAPCTDRGASARGGDRGRRADGPLIAAIHAEVGRVEVILGQVGKTICMALSGLSNLDVVVVPAEHLTGLESGQELALGDVVGTGGKQAATDKIDSVVVRKVHGGPPKPASVNDEQGAKLGESVAHEQGFNGSTSGMQRGESTEDHGRGGESGSVQVDTEELIDRGKTSGGTLHRVVGGSETVHVLIPRRRAGEEELDHDTGQVHVTKGSCKRGSGSRRAEEEHEARADKGSTEMGDTVRQPGEDIEGDGLVGREDVAQVCAVEDVFESGQHANPDRRSVFAVDESAKIVSAEEERRTAGEMAEEREQQTREVWHTGRRRRRRAMRQLARMAGRTGE
jgi:hypothetical protein